MKNNKVAIIVSPRAPYSKYLVEKVKCYGVDGYHSLIGGYYNYPVRFLRKIFFKYNLPFKEIFFDIWKKYITDYEQIIILRDSYGEFMAEYINSNSNANVVLYFMDPYDMSVFWKNYTNKKCIISSFEKKLCQVKGYIYNPLFCFRELSVEKNIKKDIFFIGTNKGRLKDLIKYEKEFRDLGLKTYFHICRSSSNKYDDLKKYEYKEKIPYSDVLEHIRESRALLEILPEGQCDMTLRGYEAYFFKKKLITNNQNISNYTFYNKNNVFILGMDDINKLPQFIKSEYVDIVDKNMEECEFKNWIKKYEQQKVECS